MFIKAITPVQVIQFFIPTPEKGVRSAKESKRMYMLGIPTIVYKIAKNVVKNSFRPYSKTVLYLDPYGY